MMPASNQGVGENIGFPDVCNTPVGPATAPLPYPNTGSNSMAMPFCPTLLVSMMPAHNQGAKPLMTNGDNAGVAHSSFMMSGGNNMGIPTVLMSGMPAETLCNPTQGNNYNCPLDSKLVPSAVNVLVAFHSAELLQDLADRPRASWGLTLDGQGRVLHVARGSAAARRGIVPGARAAADARGLRVTQGGRQQRFAATDARTSAVPGRLVFEGRGARLVLERLSWGAPGFVRQALDALEADGARALTLDLCGCPGGSVEVALELAALLNAWRGSLEVLVDAQTASAAEVLAALLRDAGRAPLRGERTYGKGHGWALRLERGRVRAAAPVRLLRADGRALDLGLTPDLRGAGPLDA
ncbi:MAG: PAAR-like domain-containing protein [Planctomycetota bacterium]